MKTNTVLKAVAEASKKTATKSTNWHCPWFFHQRKVPAEILKSRQGK